MIAPTCASRARSRWHRGRTGAMGLRRGIIAICIALGAFLVWTQHAAAECLPATPCLAPVSGTTAPLPAGNTASQIVQPVSDPTAQPVQQVIAPVTAPVQPTTQPVQQVAVPITQPVKAV